jgi:hypothetical protein
VELPLRFPDPLEEAARRADEFQRLSRDERVRQLMDTVETGLELLRHSPHREASDRLFQQREAEWQEIQRKLFIRHGV